MDNPFDLVSNVHQTPLGNIFFIAPLLSNQILKMSRKNLHGFRPAVPKTIPESMLPEGEIEKLILKHLFRMRIASGRQLAEQLKLLFCCIDSFLRELKDGQLLSTRGTAAGGDFEYQLTDLGWERARRSIQECGYSGCAPVALSTYIESVGAQTMTEHSVTEEELEAALSGLVVNRDLVRRIGPAINSGRGMFLYGMPGNGKTSIAKRVICSQGSIWIPRTLYLEGEIVQLFDASVHVEVSVEESSLSSNVDGHDERWVRIQRPTVVAGGELTMSELEVTKNLHTHTCEAPLQLKSNCGALVIDDFGRQTMPVDVLLNRWIVPLEERVDYLNMPSGKKIQVPFDQLIVFSTNLEPRDLVDGAFLRRIPYKIEVNDPSVSEFRKIFRIAAESLDVEFDADAVDYLIKTHYTEVERPFRACQPRDLIQQVKNYCGFKDEPPNLSPESLDFAVQNYFSIM